MNKEFWTITYHNRYSKDALECVHKDLKDTNVFYYTMHQLPEYFWEKYEIDFVMIMHQTKFIRVFMIEKGKDGTL